MSRLGHRLGSSVVVGVLGRERKRRELDERIDRGSIDGVITKQESP